MPTNTTGGAIAGVGGSAGSGPGASDWAAELGARAWGCAQAALEHYLNSDVERFAHETVRAIELGGKAILVGINPVLVADPRSVDSQLHLAGHAVGDRRLRTISARETLDRLGKVLPPIRDHDLLPLVDIRDGATHFVAGTHAPALGVLVHPWLSAIGVVQSALKAEDADAFGRYADTAATLREEHGNRIRQIVACKIARARKSYEERYAAMEPETQAIVFKAIDASIRIDGYDEQSADCPSCSRAGIIGGEHEFQEWVPDYDVADGEGYVSGVYPRVSLFARYFQCPFCGLRLEDADELETAGLEIALDVPDARAEDFVEPDEDMYDDR